MPAEGPIGPAQLDDRVGNRRDGRPGPRRGRVETLTFEHVHGGLSPSYGRGAAARSFNSKIGPVAILRDSPSRTGTRIWRETVASDCAPFPALSKTGSHAGHSCGPGTRAWLHPTWLVFGSGFRTWPRDRCRAGRCGRKIR